MVQTHRIHVIWHTLPKTNMSPENGCFLILSRFQNWGFGMVSVHFQVRTCCWNVSGRVFFTPTLIRWSVPQGPWAARHFPGKFHGIGGKKRKPGTVSSADCSHYGSSHRRELPRFPANGWFNSTFIQSFALCVLACFFESYRFYGKWNDIPFFSYISHHHSAKSKFKADVPFASWYIVRVLGHGFSLENQTKQNQWQFFSCLRFTCLRFLLSHVEYEFSQLHMDRVIGAHPPNHFPFDSDWFTLSSWIVMCS